MMSDENTEELRKDSRRLKALYKMLLNPGVEEGFDVGPEPTNEEEFNASLDRFADFLKI